MDKIKNTLQSMFDFQASNNDKTRPEWRTANFAWYRAMAVEAFEALDSTGWEWWKKTGVDILNLKVELVDIMHFYMSHVMVRLEDEYPEKGAAMVGHEIDQIANWVSDWSDKYNLLDNGSDVEKLRLRIEEFISGLTAGGRGTETLCEDECSSEFITFIYDICGGVFENFDEFAKMYFAKNQLNGFRQANGYKDKTYIKMWMDIESGNKVEDNVIVFRLANTIDFETADQFFKELDEKVGQYYHTIVKGA